MTETTIAGQSVRECAEWLADRAGLARHPNRETWIKSCVEIILAQRGIGRASAVHDMEAERAG